MTPTKITINKLSETRNTFKAQKAADKAKLRALKQPGEEPFRSTFENQTLEAFSQLEEVIETTKNERNSKARNSRPLTAAIQIKSGFSDNKSASKDKKVVTGSL
jgi:hypothetical protein